MSTILHVNAEVLYWEDALINGVVDTIGELVPFRVGDNWCPRIDIETGVVLDWPSGTTAHIHYKVCDQGEYFIECDGKRFKYQSYYVPDRFLCHGKRGYGDYIIIEIGEDGKIADYVKPEIESDEWQEVTP